MGHLGEIQFPFPFPSFPMDYFDIQDLKILLSIISFHKIFGTGPSELGNVVCQMENQTKSRQKLI